MRKLTAFHISFPQKPIRLVGRNFMSFFKISPRATRIPTILSLTLAIGYLAYEILEIRVTTADDYAALQQAADPGLGDFAELYDYSIGRFYAQLKWTVIESVMSLSSDILRTFIRIGAFLVCMGTAFGFMKKSFRPRVWPGNFFYVGRKLVGCSGHLSTVVLQSTALVGVGSNLADGHTFVGQRQFEPTHIDRKPVCPVPLLPRIEPEFLYLADDYLMGQQSQFERLENLASDRIMHDGWHRLRHNRTPTAVIRLRPI